MPVTSATQNESYPRRSARLARSTTAAVPERINGAAVTPSGLPPADPAGTTGGCAVSMTATMRLASDVVWRESDQVIRSRHSATSAWFTRPGPSPRPRNARPAEARYRQPVPARRRRKEAEQWAATSPAARAQRAPRGSARTPRRPCQGYGQCRFTYRGLCDKNSPCRSATTLRTVSTSTSVVRSPSVSHCQTSAPAGCSCSVHRSASVEAVA